VSVANGSAGKKEGWKTKENLEIYNEAGFRDSSG